MRRVAAVVSHISRCSDGVVLLVGCLASIALSCSTRVDWKGACVSPLRMVAAPIRVSAPAARAEMLVRRRRPGFERVALFAQCWFLFSHLTTTLVKASLWLSQRQWCAPSATLTHRRATLTHRRAVPAPAHGCRLTVAWLRRTCELQQRSSRSRTRDNGLDAHSAQRPYSFAGHLNAARIYIHTWQDTHTYTAGTRSGGTSQAGVEIRGVIVRTQQSVRLRR